MSRAALYYLLPVVLGALLNLTTPAPASRDLKPSVSDSLSAPVHECAPTIDQRRDITVTVPDLRAEPIARFSECANGREEWSGLP